MYKIPFNKPTIVGKELFYISQAINEDETTIIVPSSRVAMGQADGCIELRVKGGRA